MQPVEKLILMTIGLIIPVALGGCGSGGSAVGTGATGGSAPELHSTATKTGLSSTRSVAISGGGSLQITLSTDSPSYARGVPVQITLKVKNTGSTPISYFSSGVGEEVLITDASGTVVWQYSRAVAGYGFPVLPVTLPPGQSFTSALPWDQKETHESRPPSGYVPPGQYSISAWWTPESLNDVALTAAEAQSQLSPAPLTVVIQDGPTPPEPPSPAAPSGLTATAGSKGITLSWTPGAGDVSFNIYRRTADSSYGPILDEVGGSSLVSNSETAGVTYYYVVRGIGADESEGPPSNEASVVAPTVINVPPGPPGSATGPIAT